MDRFPIGPMSTVNILVIEDDPATQAALRQVLDAEEWRVQVVTAADTALQVLASGDWTLVLASVGTTGLNGALYTILKALSEAREESGKRIRVLFLIPEAGAGTAQPQMERDHLQYVLKPFNFHDILEKVSDLLVDAGAIPQSIRQVRREAGVRRIDAGRRTFGKGNANRNTQMFASRADHSDYSMTEEEVMEFERQDEQIRRKKKDIKDLGSGR
jgi:DNA-binding response OmpR family regulator